MDSNLYPHKHVLIFNGPPGSGKDEATTTLMNTHPNTNRVVFKDTLNTDKTPAEKLIHGWNVIPDGETKEEVMAIIDSLRGSRWDKVFISRIYKVDYVHTAYDGAYLHLENFPAEYRDKIIFVDIFRDGVDPNAYHHTVNSAFDTCNMCVCKEAYDEAVQVEQLHNEQCGFGAEDI